MKSIKLKSLEGIPKTTVFRRLSGFAITVLAIGFLAFRAYQGINDFALSDVSFSVEYIFLSIVFQFVGVAIAAAIWSGILNNSGVRTGYRFDLRAYGLSALGRKIPGVIWYAVGRMLIYATEGVAKRTILASTVMEMLINSISGILIVILTMAIGEFELPIVLWSSTSFNISFLIIAAFVLVSLVVLHRPIPFITERIRILQVIRNSYSSNWDVVRWIVTNMLVIVLGAGVLFSVNRTISTLPQLSYYHILGAWGLLVGIGPIVVWLPGEIGLKDGLMYILLSPVIGGPTTAILILFWRGWISTLEIIFGIFSGLSLALSKKHNIRLSRYD